MAALNSDHVNYLVWRYLQEQGYGKAAIQLSRDWSIDDPQSLPFVDHVKPHDLTRMLQDALAYDQLAADARKTQDQAIDGRGVQDTPSKEDNLGKRWSFVEIKKRKPIEEINDWRRIATSDDVENKRKRPRRDTNEGMRPSGRRKSLRPSGQEVEQTRDAMDIDVDATKRESHHTEQDVEHQVQTEPPPPPTPPPPPHTLEIGQSTGVQSEKIKEEPILRTVASHTIPGAEIYRVDWDDKHHDRLTVSGGSVCHSLTLHPGLTGSNQDATPDKDAKVFPIFSLHAEEALQKHEDLIKYSIAQWEKQSVQQIVAAAVEELQDGRQARSSIQIFESSTSTVLTETSSVVFALKWSPDSSKILTCWDAAQGCSSYLGIWSLDDRKLILCLHSRELIRDVVWLDDERFACCGARTIQFCKITDDAIIVQLRIDTDITWEQMKYESQSKLIVCMPDEDGILGVVDSSEGTLRTKTAHDDSITSIQWEPRPDSGHNNSGYHVERYRVLATTCIGGCLKLWKTMPALECLHTFSFGPIMPVWSIAFSPNGSRLAAVTGQHVQIWEDVGSDVRWSRKEDIKFLAKWLELEGSKHDADKGETHRIEQSSEGHAHEVSSMEGVGDFSSLFSLAWNVAGSRLALAQGNTIFITEVPGGQVDQDAEMT